ncbi:hypothetical protein P8452_44757 [Trifolium repens]|nr:hypothetical protein P8452_44757 [Trifolium repens]
MGETSIGKKRSNLLGLRVRRCNESGRIASKATGAVAKTSELLSSGMEIEIAELLYVSSSVSEDEKEQEVAMSLIMLSRDVRPWCDINSIAEFSDNNNHDDNENGKDDDKKKEKMEIEVDSDSTFEVNVR